jgi:hypothetical protein
MKLIRSVFIFLSLAFSLNTTAESVVIECYECTSEQRHSKALSWGEINAPYIPKPYVDMYDPPLITILNLKGAKASTYKVWKEDGFYTPGASRQFHVIARQTEIDVKVASLLDELKHSLNDFRGTVLSMTVPDDVIEDAWEFVGCGYCKDRVHEWLEGKFGYHKERVSQTIADLVAEFHLIRDELPRTYRLDLEAGGYIVIELTLRADTEFSLEVLEAFDQDNNEIELDVTNLGSTAYYLNDADRAREINDFIIDFGYFLPTQSGRVTIEQCPDGDVVGGPCS